uniref:Uncharacterized protein n=1 Tax=Setaria italica TaxID=4555 RepID=K3YEG1_SETIT
MADCFPPEADDLHRRWLPREIFADIGIVDTEAASDAPTEADAVGVEELAAQLAGILGGGSKVCPLAPPPPPPTPAPSVAAPRHGAQVSVRGASCSGARGLRPVPGVSLVCGLEGSVAVTCGGTNAAGGGAAVSWPFVPYPSAHWQGASNLMNLGGVLDYYYSAFPPAPPCPVPPPANLRGGTGVFIPRTARDSDKGVAWDWQAGNGVEAGMAAERDDSPEAAAAAEDTTGGEGDWRGAAGLPTAPRAGAAPGLELPLMEARAVAAWM